jgi:hypothetical protein
MRSRGYKRESTSKGGCKGRRMRMGNRGNIGKEKVEVRGWG